MSQNALEITPEKADFMTQKANDYSLQILDGIAKSAINQDELTDPDNLKAFIQALANLVPHAIHHNLTGEDITVLEFNHLANNVAVDYGFYHFLSTPEAEEQETEEIDPW